MHDIPLLLVAERPSGRQEFFVNGFPVRWFAAADAGHDGQAAGLQRTLIRYSVLHPYALRPTGNVLQADLGTLNGPASKLDLQVVSLGFQPGQPLGTTFPLTLLGGLNASVREGAAAQLLQSRFDSPGCPVWDWVNAPLIEDTVPMRESLRVALGDTWDALYRMGSGTQPAGWLESVRSSTRDFQVASERGGKKALALDRLIDVATKLRLPNDESPEEFLRRVEARTKRPTTLDDAPAQGGLPQRLANGALPPRLKLRYLSSYEGLTMQTLGQGRLARMTDAAGEPLIQFQSNYPDGPRGRSHTVRFTCDPLYRLNLRQQWELAALYPTSMAAIAMANPWPQELLDALPY